MSVNFDWTAETEALARRMWLAGRSASQICEALDGAVSRNAVIGKMNRLGVMGGSRAAPRPAVASVEPPADAEVDAPAPRAAVAQKPKVAPEIAPPDRKKLAEIERRRELAAYDRIEPPAAVPPSVSACAPALKRMVKDKILRASNVTAFARKQKALAPATPESRLEGFAAVNAARRIERLAASPGLPAAPPISAVEALAYSPRRLSIMDIDVNQCRRLLDDDVYCGLPTPSREPWCAHCRTRMIVAPKPPKPREPPRAPYRQLIGYATGAK